MKFADIVSALNARVVAKSTTFNDCSVDSVIVSDLMSDALMMEKVSPLIVSSLSSDQTHSHGFHGGRRRRGRGYPPNRAA